uniref:Secreted protein n=1 Tax=Panagrellus redivivus TaxID=6233 RepID=A0A7E4V1K8_PANRE
MQNRSLFAGFILGFAVSIAFAKDHDSASLEKMSLGKLSGVMVEAYREFMLEADSESQRKVKLELVNGLPNYPELEDNLDLPVNQFCDLVRKTVIDNISQMPPSRQAADKKRLITLIKLIGG